MISLFAISIWFWMASHFLQASANVDVSHAAVVQIATRLPQPKHTLGLAAAVHHGRYLRLESEQHDMRAMTCFDERRDEIMIEEKSRFATRN
jgi:hypothetical protein